MGARKVIRYIQTASKRTPVEVYLSVAEPIEFKGNKVFGERSSFAAFGNYETIAPVLEAKSGRIIEIEIEATTRYSTVPLLDIKKINARIEPGTIIRDQVSIGNNAVVMMGAIINIGAVIGENTMTDMGAVLGGQAIVGRSCHIGAETVLAGMIKPASAKPVIVEDGVLIGANAVVIEGVHTGKDAVAAVGAVVLEGVAAGTIVGGIPARVLKVNNDQTRENTALIAALHEL